MHNLSFNKRMLFIVNPVSGNGKSNKILPTIEEYLKKNEVNYEVVFTKYKGHASELAHTYSKDSDAGIIVVVGGDGTLNEVVNGLFPSKVPIGYIPTGTGNDYAKEMGISKYPIDAIKRVLKMELMTMDLGDIGGRYFVNVASMGFDGEVANIANDTKLKKIFGKLVYVYGVIKVLWTYKPKTIKVMIDNENHIFENVWLIAIANNRYYGGGMKISPNSIHNDGEFEICVINNLTRFQLLKLFPTIFYGGHIKYPMVHLLKGKEIHVEASEELFIQSDGEIQRSKELNVKVKENGVIVI